MLTLASGQEIHLSSSRRGSAKTSTSAKENKFGHISEVKTDTTSVRTSVLADFVPNDIGFVRESPPLHYLKAFEDHCVRNPKVEMRLRRRS